jgi:hypothetical protein
MSAAVVSVAAKSDNLLNLLPCLNIYAPVSYYLKLKKYRHTSKKTMPFLKMNYSIFLKRRKNFSFSIMARLMLPDVFSSTRGNFIAIWHLGNI